ncbi:unnamed protein product [Clavelina lepadiformis]|uniref:Coiled-coil domain-containing protein 186 n=1 Tax=Clavelina lepadiformis TaxID=159417 RepID=A0ABP0F8C3_CLALP
MVGLPGHGLRMMESDNCVVADNTLVDHLEDQDKMLLTHEATVDSLSQLTVQIKLHKNDVASVTSEQSPGSSDNNCLKKFEEDSTDSCNLSSHDNEDCASGENDVLNDRRENCSENVLSSSENVTTEINGVEMSQDRNVVDKVHTISKTSHDKTSQSNDVDVFNKDDAMTDVELPSFTITFGDGSEINVNEETKSIPVMNELEQFMWSHIKKINSHSEYNNLLKVSETKVRLNNLEQKVNELVEVNKKLESQNLELKHNVKQTEEKLSSHDAAAKRTITRLHADSETKIKELNKQCALADKEKQASVMNYARREKELLDLRRRKDGAEQFAREAGKERDKVISQLKGLRADMIKMKNSHEKKETESGAQNKEIEKLKEEINSQKIKVRWAQNKLKSEIDSHKETKEKCDKMVLEIQQAKEETEQIRKNCQGMIKTYQESEEIKSNSLDIQLKEKNQLLCEKEAENDESRSLLKQRNEELNLLKIRHKDVFEENQVLKSKVECLDEERLKNEQTLHSYEEVINKQKATNSEMNEKMQYIFELELQTEELKVAINKLKAALHDADEAQEVCLNDLSLKERKEHELLEFTEKVTSKNTQLTVQIEDLNSKLFAQNSQLETNKDQIEKLQKGHADLTAAKENMSSEHFKSQTTMNSRLEEKERTICQLLLQLEEIKDEMRTVKRKNAASVKDLTRQLTQAKKKMDNVDSLSVSSAPNHTADGGSIGSRTSSITSLDKLSSCSPDGNGSSNATVAYEAIAIPETTVAGPDSLDRQLLIERIVRLQQIHAKKNEKIDFLTEHVQQLLGAVQKKQRIILHYIMREESGALAPPRPVNDGHKSKSSLTLELSIEINRKMQSVLEDTLLKNITLKESLEVLGKEVERLSHESKPN